jgi:type IV pilus assembly protein PilE
MITLPFPFKKSVKAYTLTEILVVLVIIGILVLLALPNLLPVITKAKSTEAKIQLKHLQTLEQSYFYEHSRYSNDFSELGFIQEKLTTEGDDGRANYRIEVITATGNAFLGRATAVKDFNGDGKYDTWEIDQDGNLKHITSH